MQVILLAIVRKIGSVAMAMLVEMFTARFIRRVIGQGIKAIVKKTKTTADDEILEAAEAEGVFESDSEGKK